MHLLEVTLGYASANRCLLAPTDDEQYFTLFAMDGGPIACEYYSRASTTDGNSVTQLADSPEEFSNTLSGLYEKLLYIADLKAKQEAVKAFEKLFVNGAYVQLQFPFAMRLMAFTRGSFCLYLSDDETYVWFDSITKTRNLWAGWPLPKPHETPSSIPSCAI